MVGRGGVEPPSAHHASDLQSTRKATGLPDYGLTQANFAVIRPPQYPAVLVECAFMILPEQEELLDNDAFVSRVAHGIADGIADFAHEQFRLQSAP